MFPLAKRIRGQAGGLRNSSETTEGTEIPDLCSADGPERILGETTFCTSSRTEQLPE